MKWIEKKSWANEEKAKVLEMCNKEYQEFCGHIEERHDDCADWNYHRGGKAGPAYFNQGGYKTCLELGIEKIRQSNRERIRQEHKNLQELNEFIRGGS